GLFFYTKISSIISIGDLPTTNIIEPQFLTTTKEHREQVNPRLQDQPETKPECQEVLAHSLLKDKKANTDKIDEK
ncbi:hypothetical protein RLC43_02570, partial [Streptococcus pneumoniae]|nr:hypothetical protein [Streptococcus pneumoniae]MDS5446639.1 hypothetical protein [Streptococcus pneumoniae]